MNKVWKRHDTIHQEPQWAGGWLLFASNWDIERQRRKDRTKSIQNNDYKSSIKRQAKIYLKKLETVTYIYLCI